jgi:hypothetical protein
LRVDIFGFPEALKREINRILRHRHCLVHQDEIWEDGQFIRTDFPKLESDIATTKDIVSRIQESFKEKIGTSWEIARALKHIDEEVEESKSPDEENGESIKTE